MVLTKGFSLLKIDIGLEMCLKKTQDKSVFPSIISLSLLNIL